MAGADGAAPGAVRVLTPRGADALRDWARRRGYPCRAVGEPGSVGFLARWSALARGGGPLLYVDYPQDDAADEALLDRFVAEALARGQGLYYAPRPNGRLGAAPVALALLPAARPVPLRALVLRAVLGAARVPFLRLRLGLRMRIEGAVRAARARLLPLAPGPGPAPGAAPAEVAPGWLAQLGGPWHSWNPGRETLRRDVVGRAPRFYPAPRTLQICLLNKCNLQCVMCPYHSPHYTPHHASDYLTGARSMTPEVFARIAEYAGRHRIGLFFGQIEEPLLHRDIFAFFRQARARGVREIHLSTNATLLDAAKARALAASGVTSVRFSLDAATPQTYRAIRGRDLREVERNVAAFLRLARPRGIATSVAFILQPEAIGERHAFLEKWRDMGVDGVVVYGLTRYDLRTGEPLVDGRLCDPGQRYPCSQPWIQAAVFPEGQVSVCCRTLASVGWRGVLSMGDLRREDFEAIWAGERFAAMRGELFDGAVREFDICRACPAWPTDAYRMEDTPRWRRSYNFFMEEFLFNRGRPW